jgi:hypothetical protein
MVLVTYKIPKFQIIEIGSGSISGGNQHTCANYANSNQDHRIWIQRPHREVKVILHIPARQPLLVHVVLQ